MSNFILTFIKSDDVQILEFPRFWFGTEEMFIESPIGSFAKETIILKYAN